MDPDAMHHAAFIGYDWTLREGTTCRRLARGDLNELYDWISSQASPTVAMGYLERVEVFCRRLSVGSERGHLRSDIRPDLRIIGFERRLTIAFVVQEETVTVLRVFTAGRNWETSF